MTGSLASRRPRRRKACRLCSLPASEADLVEGGVLSGWSSRSVAARFASINRRDIARHMRNCVVSEEKKEEK